MARPRKHLALTDAVIRAAIRAKEPVKLFDGHGLFLFTPTARWRWERVLEWGTKGGKRKATKSQTVTYGEYPHLGLQAARKAHAKAREVVAEGGDPNEIKKATKQFATFGDMAEKWYVAVQADWSDVRRKQMRRWLDKHVIPELGKRAITDLDVNDTLQFLARREAPHVAANCKFIIGKVLMYYCHKGQCPGKRLAEIGGIVALLRGAVKVPKTEHHTPLNVEDIPDFLKKLDAYPGHPTTVAAAKLLLLLAVRKRELTEARWSEFDLDKAEWVIPAARMKGREAHWVPLSQPVLRLLRALHTLYQGRTEFVLPQERNLGRPMDPWTVNNVFKEVGIQAVPHGLRSTFSTWANDQPDYRPDVIEACLAHVEPNRVRRTYNNARMKPERRQLMADWATFIAVQGTELKRAA